MKLLSLALTLFIILAMSGTIGCSKKIAVDTVKLEYSFQAAEQATQTAVTEAIEAIEKADYSVALERLKKVSADPKLTAEQKTAVAGVIGQLESR